MIGARGQPVDGRAHHVVERRVGRAARRGRLLQASSRAAAIFSEELEAELAERGLARRAHDGHRAPAPGSRRGGRARAADRLPGGVRVEGDARGFRVAVCADALVNPEPGGLDALAVCERTGFGVMQLPATWYPDDVAAGWLEQVAEQLDEYLRRGYAVVLLTARRATPRPRASARRSPPRSRRSATPCRPSSRAPATRTRSRRSCAPSPCPPPPGERGAARARRPRRHAGRRPRGRRRSIEGERIVARHAARRGSRTRRDRRPRLHRAPGRRRRARARRPRLPADGRHDGDLGRPLRGCLARRGGGRHDDDHRLRDAGRGRGPAGPARAPPATTSARAPSTSRCTAGCSRPIRRRCARSPSSSRAACPRSRSSWPTASSASRCRTRICSRSGRPWRRPAGSCRRTARAGRSSGRGSRPRWPRA